MCTLTASYFSHLDKLFYRFLMNMPCSFVWIAHKQRNKACICRERDATTIETMRMTQPQTRYVVSSRIGTIRTLTAFELFLFSRRKIRHIKNEEHTPHFHIWNNLIQLFILLFLSFFPARRLLILFGLLCVLNTQQTSKMLFQSHNVRTCLRLISINSWEIAKCPNKQKCFIVDNKKLQ